MSLQVRTAMITEYAPEHKMTNPLVVFLHISPPYSRHFKTTPHRIIFLRHAKCLGIKQKISDNM